MRPKQKGVQLRLVLGPEHSRCHLTPVFISWGSATCAGLRLHSDPGSVKINKEKFRVRMEGRRFMCERPSITLGRHSEIS